MLSVHVSAQPVPSAPPTGSTDQPTDVLLRWRQTTNNLYEVYITKRGDTEPWQVLYSDTDRVNTINLPYETTFEWKVRGFDAGTLPGPWCDVQVFTTMSAGDRPLLISPADTETEVDTNATMVWTGTSPSMQYEIEIDTQPTFDLTTPVPVQATSFGVLLSSGKQYHWHVRGISAAGGLGPWSQTFTYTTVTPTAQPPNALRLISPANGSSDVPYTVVLTWEIESQADGYILEVAMESDPDMPIIVATVPNPPYTVVLPPNTDAFLWRVRAFEDNGISEWSDTWTFTTVDTADKSLPMPNAIFPMQNATIAADVMTQTKLVWEFEPNIAGVDSSDVKFTVQWSINEALTDTSNTATTTAMQLPLDSLRVGDVIRWRVSAFTWWAESPWTPDRSFSIVALPTKEVSAPVLLTPTDGSIDVQRTPEYTWTGVEGATAYHAEISTDDAFTGLANAFQVNNEIGEGDTLEAGRRFWWRVRAENVLGLGPWSSVFSFTTGQDITSVDEEQHTSAYLYSNPARGSTAIVLMNAEDVSTTVRLIAHDGRTVMQGIISAGETLWPMDVSEYASGRYTILLSSGVRTQVLPLIILQ